MDNARRFNIRLIKGGVYRMSHLSNCKHCGSAFIKNKSDYCNHCQSLYDHYYTLMREHIRKHPNSSLIDLERHTQIPFTVLQRIVKEEFSPYSK